MAAQVLKFNVRFPWWTRIYLWAGILSLRFAILTGLPVTQRHADALGERMADVLIRNVRLTIVG